MLSDVKKKESIDKKLGHNSYYLQLLLAWCIKPIMCWLICGGIWWNPNVKMVLALTSIFKIFNATGCFITDGPACLVDSKARIGNSLPAKLLVFIYWKLCARLWYLHCYDIRDTTVLRSAIDIQCMVALREASLPSEPRPATYSSGYLEN